MEALKMETPMDNWNDDRLDELSRRVDEGFKETKEGFVGVDNRFERVEREMKEGFEKVATRESVAEVSARLDRFESRIDRLYWAFIALAVILTANGIVGNAWG